jgi:hypothetical protein
MRSRGSRTAASSSTAADIGIGLVLFFLALVCEGLVCARAFKQQSADFGFSLQHYRYYDVTASTIGDVYTTTHAGVSTERSRMRSQGGVDVHLTKG